MYKNKRKILIQTQLRDTLVATNTLQQNRTQSDRIVFRCYKLYKQNMEKIAKDEGFKDLSKMLKDFCDKKMIEHGMMADFGAHVECTPENTDEWLGET